MQNGSFSYRVWNGQEFEKVQKTIDFRNAEAEFETVKEPFFPPYADELNLESERNRTWKKITVTSPDGFIGIDYVGDAAQIYADGELVADEFYLGEVWRIPAALLYGKECYLVYSELKDDCYREF